MTQDFAEQDQTSKNPESQNAAQRQLKRVHFIGVAGSGMAGIAYVAHQSGIAVSGSDLGRSSYVEPLLRAGAQVTFEHNAANVADPTIELVVISTAIPSTNPELIAARERGLEVWPRARMLAYLGRGKQVLAVSGTHGKTTTSSMLATALVELGADPSFLIGGVLNAYDTSAHYAPGSHMVMEADESDASFTWLDPTLAIVTNIEADHMDHFESLNEIKASFLAFLAKLAKEGLVVACATAPDLIELVIQSGKPYLTYGDRPEHGIYFEPTNATGDTSSFDVIFPDKERCRLELPCSPGIHNMLNATAVMATLDWLGFDRQESAQAISKFKGAHRRFDKIGEAAGVAIVDDYGHHPTEIAATLAAAQRLSYTKVHLLFQPHRFTRTQAFIHEFATAFDDASTITLMDIFTAGETPIPGIDSNLLLKVIKRHNPRATIRLISQRSQIAPAMAQLAQPGSLVITMGAGDVTKMAPAILEALEQKAGQ
jgi:UDP-N-acetylmuramate--alanine ligase